MLIDWFTVIAQVINFLILVWLLKRFLYRPILDAIDARELRIAKTLADAANKEKQAQQERDLFLHKNNQLEKQSEKLLQTATTAANEEAQRLLGKARQIAADLCVQQQATFQKQQQSLSVELTQKTQQEVFAITRQALKDLAESTLEDQILKVFLRRLCELDKETKLAFSSAIEANHKPVRVRTTFALQPDLQKRLSDALNATFATEIDIKFETTPDIISGIELNINGQKLAWSITQYIDSLEQHFQQIVEQSAQHAISHQSGSDDSLPAGAASLAAQFTEKQENLPND
jgi:F-type H+-transporting ATPase subunit b